MDELERIHKNHDDGKKEVIDFILKFLKEDKKECDEGFIDEKKKGDINEKNEEFWKGVLIGRDSLEDRIEYELNNKFPNLGENGK